MPRMLTWYDNASDNEIGEFADGTGAEDAPLCPKCGAETTYEEGRVDQDVMGNDIEGYWFVCWPCGISTEWFEF